jgi:hypothetical protein
LERLVRTSIRNAKDWKLQTLAVVTNALADMEVQNVTLFTIVKNIVMEIEIEEKAAETGMEIPEKKGPNKFLTPLDCA